MENAEEDIDATGDVPTDLGAGLFVATEEGPTAADFSCFAKVSALRAGQTVSHTLSAVAFGYRNERGEPFQVPGLEIQIFLDNRIPRSLACEKHCERATDLGDGRYRFDAPEEGWFAYRVLSRPADDLVPAVLPTVEVNFESGPDEAFNVMLADVLDGLHEALGFARDPERSLVAGRLLDCSGSPVEGATVDLFDLQGHPIDVEQGAVKLYMDQMGPNPELRFTSATGQWSMANVPVGEGQVQVRAFDQQGNLVACEVAATAPAGFSPLRLRPLRADGPECFE